MLAIAITEDLPLCLKTSPLHRYLISEWLCGENTRKFTTDTESVDRLKERLGSIAVLQNWI